MKRIPVFVVVLALLAVDAGMASADETIATNIYEYQGRLGVGVTQPQLPLESSGSFRARNFCYFGSGNNYSGFFFLRNPNGSTTIDVANRIGEMTNANHDMSLRGLNNHNVRITDDSDNGLIVKDGGNVGIGTMTPTQKLHVAGNILANNDVSCAVLEIRGAGNDLAEAFKVNGNKKLVQPGMVVSIDAKNAGELALASTAYDRKVAGIISGAGDLHAGVHLGDTPSGNDGRQSIALTGRVWCWVDASYGAVSPGDLLTTSDTLGHAMKATDHAQAQGATIGKAMTELREGKGLVLVLVNLQ